MVKSFIIDDSTSESIHSPSGITKGLVQRDYSLYPQEMFSPPSNIPLIPRNEWDARIEEMEEKESTLEHIWLRSGQENLDQNGQGYCWSYSTGHSLMACGFRDNYPIPRLSPHAVACKIKNFKDEGGWCGLSAKFAREVGYPSVEYWPEDSMDRKYDNAETWKNAKLYRIEQDYVDLTRDVWGQNLTFDQVATCLLLNIPCPCDFYWWSHSVCAMRLVKISAGHYGLRILNSWKGWGEKGFATLAESKSIPNGAVATRQIFLAV